MAYRGRLLMAVQAEFGESASESGIRQVEVEPTAPISDVSWAMNYSMVLFWGFVKKLVPRSIIKYLGVIQL